MIASETAEALRQRGFSVIGVSEPNDEVDGSVDLTERLSVQVSADGGVNVFEVLPDARFKFGPTRFTVEDLVPDLIAVGLRPR